MAPNEIRTPFIDDAFTPAGVKLVWSISLEWDEWAQHGERCYVLRTNVTKWSDEELWRTYIQISDAEAAFRVQKRDLSIRPAWHPTASRVKAHGLVCFLAYVLWKTVEAWQQPAGLGNSPRVLLDELARIQSADVVLPLADQPGREMRLRCVVRPEPHQTALLARLGLRLPARLVPLAVTASVDGCSSDVEAFRRSRVAEPGRRARGEKNLGNPRPVRGRKPEEPLAGQASRVTPGP